MLLLLLAAAERRQSVTKQDVRQVCEAMIYEGVLGRGRGRRGSVYRRRNGDEPRRSRARGGEFATGGSDETSSADDKETEAVCWDGSAERDYAEWQYVLVDDPPALTPKIDQLAS